METSEATLPVMTCDFVAPGPANAAPGTGTCSCGAVEISVTGEPIEMGYCHCRSCRAYSGAPVSAYMLFEADRVRVVRGAALIGSHSKSEMSVRQFCRRCGGHLMTQHPPLGLTDVHAGILPGMPFRPVIHLHYVSTVLPIRDGLPKLHDFPEEVGGSGRTIAE